MKAPTPKNFNDYVAHLDDDIRIRLQKIRKALIMTFPTAEEAIKYGMPSFKVNGTTVYFSAYKNHIGMYPIFGGNGFEKEIQQYRGKNTKDALHFFHNKPLPLDLIVDLAALAFKRKIG